MSDLRACTATLKTGVCVNKPMQPSDPKTEKYQAQKFSDGGVVHPFVSGCFWCHAVAGIIALPLFLDAAQISSA